MTKEEFWTWFDSEKEKLERLFDGKGEDYDGIFNSLSVNLKQYSEFLIPDLKKVDENQFILVIGCDGVKKGAQYVESLVDINRRFGNWSVQKYSDPDPEEVVLVNGSTIKRSRILLTWDKLPSKNYHVVFFKKGFSIDLRYKAGVVRHLQQTVGEFNSLTRIETIEFRKFPLFKSSEKLYDLDDLKAEIDNNFA